MLIKKTKTKNRIRRKKFYLQNQLELYNEQKNEEIKKIETHKKVQKIQNSKKLNIQ